jgi:hypothetical protein
MSSNRTFWMFFLLIASLAINLMGLMKLGSSINAIQWQNEFANVVTHYKSLVHEPIRGVIESIYPNTWWRPPELLFDYLIIVSVLTLAVGAANFGNAPVAVNPVEYFLSGLLKWFIMVFLSPVVLYVGLKALAKDPSKLTADDRFFRRAIAIFGLVLVMFLVVALANYHYAQIRRY